MQFLIGPATNAVELLLFLLSPGTWGNPAIEGHWLRQPVNVFLPQT